MSNASDGTAPLEYLRSELRRARAKQNAEAATKWEYVVKKNIGADDLDDYGLRGWELVSCTSYETGFGLGGNESMRVHMQYVFKRPISEDVTEEIGQLMRTIEAGS